MLLQTEFEESGKTFYNCILGCDTFEHFIDLLLFRIDNNCFLSLEISYNINPYIIEELNNPKKY